CPELPSFVVHDSHPTAAFAATASSRRAATTQLSPVANAHEEDFGGCSLHAFVRRWLMPTPHDALVKALFSNAHDAASALASALPQGIASRIDWSTLKQENLNLVDRKFREFQSDIVFSALFEKRKVFLYVLLEHQSSGDKLMPFRMLRYSVLLWDTFLKEHPGAERLPAVLPIVLCNGKSPWASPTRFSEIIDAPADLTDVLHDHLPQFRFVLDDLSSIVDAALHSRSLSQMMFAGLLLLKKAPYTSDLVRDLAAWMDVFVSIGNAPNG